MNRTLIFGLFLFVWVLLCNWILKMDFNIIQILFVAVIGTLFYYLFDRSKQKTREKG